MQSTALPCHAHLLSLVKRDACGYRWAGLAPLSAASALGLVPLPCDKGWILKLESVHKVKECLCTFCPYGWMEISMQAAVGCIRPIKYPPATHVEYTHTYTSSLSTVKDLLKSEKLFCRRAAKHNGGQRLYMHSLYGHWFAGPVGGS